MNPHWIFDEHEMGRKERNPVNEEFFSNNTPLAAIIREGIQNSLDARICETSLREGEAPVRVRLYFSGRGSHMLSGAEYAKYRNGAESHYRMPKNGLGSDIPAPSAPCPFFAIEDFRTTGLTGDTFSKPSEQAPKVGKNYYNYFFRENLTDKGGIGSLGSWGAGKAVFQRASRIKTSFAYTVRCEGAPRAFLAGTCTLQVREDETGKTWDPDGWFGIELPKDPSNPKKLLKQPVPGNDALAASFLHDFRLERGDDPGTSIVVPYVVGNDDPSEQDDDSSVRYMAAVALVHFLPAILRGELIVDISCGETPSLRLDRTSTACVQTWLQSELADDAKGATSLHVDVVRDAVSPEFPSSRRFRLLEADPGHEWGESLFPEGSFPVIRDAVRSGTTVLFEVPVSVQTKSGRPAFDHFLVALRKVHAGRAIRPLFYRCGLLVDDVTARVPADVVSAILVERNPDRAGLLAGLLTASEPPSHSEWRPEAQRLRDGYRNGKKKIDFIRTAVSSILELLDKANADPEWDALADVFSVARPGSTPPHPPIPPDCESGPDPEPGPNPPPPEIPPRKPPRLLVEPVSAGKSHGFLVRSNPESPEFPRAGDAFSVRVFYNTLGTPDWKPSDFLLGDETVFSIVHDPADAVQISTTGNKLSVRILRNGPFSVSVRGFDGTRDIVVSAPDAEVDEGGGAASAKEV